MYTVNYEYHLTSCGKLSNSYFYTSYKRLGKFTANRKTLNI